jgi:hypothetical protein
MHVYALTSGELALLSLCPNPSSLLLELGMPGAAIYSVSVLGRFPDCIVRSIIRPTEQAASYGAQ